MVGIGKTANIQGELYEIVRTLKTNPAKVADKELTDALKDLYHAEKLFRQADGTYWFVNQIKDVEFEPVDMEEGPRASNQESLVEAQSSDNQTQSHGNDIQEEQAAGFRRHSPRRRTVNVSKAQAGRQSRHQGAEVERAGHQGP